MGYERVAKLMSSVRKIAYDILVIINSMFYMFGDKVIRNVIFIALFPDYVLSGRSLLYHISGIEQ